MLRLELCVDGQIFAVHVEEDFSVFGAVVEVHQFQADVAEIEVDVLGERGIFFVNAFFDLLVILLQVRVALREVWHRVLEVVSAIFFSLN